MTISNDDVMTNLITAMKKYDYSGTMLHAKRVESLAEMIVSALGKNSHLDPEDIYILKAACFIHDIGHFICEAEHDMAGEWLIRHDELFDSLPKKLRNDIAAIAGSHRKRLSHLIEQAGEKRMRKLIRITAILRMADALEFMQMEGIVIKQAKLIKLHLNIVVQENRYTYLLERFYKKSELFVSSYGLEICIVPQTT